MTHQAKMAASASLGCVCLRYALGPDAVVLYLLAMLFFVLLTEEKP